MSNTAEAASARAARIEKVQAIETAIVSCPGVEGQPHADVLTALMAVYIRMALAHPCCTEACVEQAVKATFILGQQVASTAPQGAPIH